MGRACSSMRTDVQLVLYSHKARDFANGIFDSSRCFKDPTLWLRSLLCLKVASTRRQGHRPYIAWTVI